MSKSRKHLPKKKSGSGSETIHRFYYLNGQGTIGQAEIQHLAGPHQSYPPIPHSHGGLSSQLASLPT